MPNLAYFLIVIGLSILPSHSIASTNDDGESVDTIVVTGSRLGRPSMELTHSIQVIDRAEIEARQVPNVTELLRQVAGLTIIQQGNRGSVTSVVVRGGEPNFTVVLIDGVKVNDSTNTRGGSYDFSYLDISTIERVEIVRGPMSAVYGSDAISGVINIITQSGSDASRIGLEVGGHGLARGMASLGGEIGDLDFLLGVHGGQEDGDIEGGSYNDFGVDVSMRGSFTGNREYGALIRHQDADSSSFPEDSGGQEFAAIRDVDRRSVRESHARFYVSLLSAGVWESDAAFNHYARREEYISPGIAPGVFEGVPPNSADTEFDRDQLVLSVAGRFSNAGSLIAGAEWQSEKGVSLGVLDIGFPLPTNFQLERETTSVFAEGEFRMGPVILQGGLRWDDPEDIDSETSAQFGAVYRLRDGRSDIRVNWGQGFKVPSFFALTHPVVGNPNLRSETATSYDIGIRHRSDDGSDSVELSIYRNDFRDLIDFDPVLFTNVNRSEVIAEGVELSFSTSIGESLRLRGHVTYSDAEIRQSTSTLRGRPRWRAGAIADWSISGKWQLVTSLLSLGKSWEVSIPTGGLYLDGYQRLDTALSYLPNERVKFVFAVDNLLDADYQEAVGFPAAGIRGRFRAIYSF